MSFNLHFFQRKVIFVYCKFAKFELFQNNVIITYIFVGLDEPCGFTRVLKSRREEEHSSFEMDCAVEREEVHVKWFYDGVEITEESNANFGHFEFVSEGYERILRVTDCPMSAAGKYKCTTSSDETTCSLKVVNVNKFLKELENVSVCETEVATFECQLVDDEASVQWLFKGEKVVESERLTNILF